MGSAVKVYTATLVAFLIIDGAWIGLIARGIYKDALGSLMREQPGVIAALSFYLIYAAGMVFFAVTPAREQTSIAIAVTNGAFLGVLAYGTFSVTNFAVLKAWTPMLLVTDVIWGAVVTAASSAAGYFVATHS
ncbi:MAG: DUF2177 family protein [Pseudomonadota bacterium]